MLSVQICLTELVDMRTSWLGHRFNKKNWAWNDYLSNSRHTSKGRGYMDTGVVSAAQNFKNSPWSFPIGRRFLNNLEIRKQRLGRGTMKLSVLDILKIYFGWKLHTAEHKNIPPRFRHLNSISIEPRRTPAIVSIIRWIRAQTRVPTQFLIIKRPAGSHVNTSHTIRAVGSACTNLELRQWLRTPSSVI